MCCETPCGITLANVTGCICKVFKECMEILAQPAKGFQDAGQSSLTLGRGVPRFLVVLSDLRSAAKMEKGTISVPLGQRFPDGIINKKFFSCWSQGKYVHDCIFRILELEWVSIIVVINRGRFRYLCKFRDGDRSVCAEASIFDNFGELRANGGVKERNATPNFAAERME